MTTNMHIYPESSIYSRVADRGFACNGIDDDGFEDVPVSSDELTDLPEVSMEDLDYLRYFIIHSADYVEELESSVCEQSDVFWESREHAYRIITGMLIDQWEARQ